MTDRVSTADKRPRTKRHRPLSLVGLIALAGCAAGGSTASQPASAQPASPVITVSSPAPTGPGVLPVCHDEHCVVAAGRYRTDRGGFFPGLAITIPTGWSVGHNDAGELKLQPNDHPDEYLLMWEDVRVVVSNHRSEPGGTIVSTVSATPAAFARWFTSDPDFTVLKTTKGVTLGRIGGLAVAVAISKSANYGDAGCPANPRCADFLADFVHGGGEFYGTGGDAADWLFFATVGNPPRDHLFVVALEAPSPADLPAFEANAQPLLDSLTVPTQAAGG